MEGGEYACQYKFLTGLPRRNDNGHKGDRADAATRIKATVKFKDQLCQRVPTMPEKNEGSPIPAPLALCTTGSCEKVPAKFGEESSVKADGLCIGCLSQWAEVGRENSNMQEFFCTTLYIPNQEASLSYARRNQRRGAIQYTLNTSRKSTWILSQKKSWKNSQTLVGTKRDFSIDKKLQVLKIVWK